MISAFATITVMFAFALALSFVVERIMELLKATYDMYDSRRNLHVFWTARAERTKYLLQTRLRLFEHTNPAGVARLLSKFNQMLLGPDHGYTGTIPVISGDMVRVVWVRVVAKLVAMSIGISMAFAFGLDLIALANDATTSTKGILLTGAAIGLGAGVVHKMITALERKRATAVLRKEAARV